MKRLLFCLLCACALHLTVSAHVLDQYLQVTQIALAPDGVRVELRLIPGVQVAERVLALIDADGDGQLSAMEEQAYAQRVLQDLALTINQQAAPLTIAETYFPERTAMSAGLGAIRLTFNAKVALNAASDQQLNFQNHHMPTISVYLVNALVPATDAIKIYGQARDALQHGLRLNFQTVAAQAGWRWLGGLLFGLLLLVVATVWLVRFRHTQGLRLERAC